MNPPTSTAIEAMLQAGESAVLDYKSAQYKFGNHASDVEQSELLKDVVAMANAWKSADAHIVVGVRENPGSRATVVGITDHFDDSRVQQFVNGKTNVPVQLAYHAVSVDGLPIAVITIAGAQPRPVWVRKKYGAVDASTVYLRRGSSTAIATPDEIAAMGEARAQTQEAIHAILKDQQARDEEQRRIDEEQRQLDHFMSFLRNEGYHDLRFPELKSDLFPMGLEYTACPQRDERGVPLVRKTEMTTMYIVRLEHRCFTKLSRAEAMAYDNAPIHTNELYFCRFYNGSWHVGQTSVGTDWHQVYLSGKLGEVEYGTTANEYQKINVPPADVKWSTQAILGPDGRPSDSGYSVTVYVTDSGVQVQPSHRAPPKQVYFARDVWAKNQTLVIDNFEGYFTGAARKPFCSWLAETVSAAGHEIPVVQVFEDSEAHGDS